MAVYNYFCSNFEHSQTLRLGRFILKQMSQPFDGHRESILCHFFHHFRDRSVRVPNDGNGDLSGALVLVPVPVRFLSLLLVPLNDFNTVFNLIAKLIQRFLQVLRFSNDVQVLFSGYENFHVFSTGGVGYKRKLFTQAKLHVGQLEGIEPVFKP